MKVCLLFAIVYLYSINTAFKIGLFDSFPISYNFKIILQRIGLLLVSLSTAQLVLRELTPRSICIFSTGCFCSFSDKKLWPEYCFVKKADPHTSLFYIHMGRIILSNKSISNLVFPTKYLLVWLRRVYISLLVILQSCCMFALNFSLLEITVPKYVCKTCILQLVFFQIKIFPQIGEIVFSQSSLFWIFFVLTLSFHLSQYVCNFFRQFWKPDPVSDTRIRSCAYNGLFTRMSASWAG